MQFSYTIDKKSQIYIFLRFNRISSLFINNLLRRVAINIHMIWQVLLTKSVLFIPDYFLPGDLFVTTSTPILKRSFFSGDCRYSFGRKIGICDTNRPLQNAFPNSFCCFFADTHHHGGEYNYHIITDAKCSGETM